VDCELWIADCCFGHSPQRRSCHDRISVAALHISIVTLLLLLGAGNGSSALLGRTNADPSPLGRLALCGRALCREDGSRFRWRGVTAFALLDLIADGKEREARAFLQWARDERFTVVRVLAMNPNGWFDLDARDGRRALPTLFRLAGEHRLYVQIVALANTAGRAKNELTEQVRQVGRLCAAADNCLLEIANEPYHSSQAKLQNAEAMRELDEQIPNGVITAWGAASDYKSDAMAGGAFIVAHIARSGERWARVARIRDLANLSRRTGKFVVDNEPIGAAEKIERSRRDTLPAVFFAQGALSRLLEVGSTFHCSDCLQAQIPGPTQKACAGAFIAGATLVPDDVVLSDVDERTPDAATLRQDIEQLGPRALAGISGNRGWLALVGENSDREISWQRSWKIEQRIAQWPGAAVWTFSR
jgi:hypothetical protein